MDKIIVYDKGRAADFTLMWVFSGTLCQRNVQPIALSLFYNERPALQYNAK